MDWYMGGFGKFLRGYLLPHMEWLYLGCLGGDKLPIGVAKFPLMGVLYGSRRALHKALDA